MKILKRPIAFHKLKEMAADTFGDMVKAVVDVEKKVIAIDAELHSDLEALLLERGSKQNDLWGINIYPDMKGDGFVEFDAMINVRPSQNNKSRSVEDENTRKQIVAILRGKIKDSLSA